MFASDAPSVPQVPRCQVMPLADDQVSFLVQGVERLRWHFGSKYPRPFFFPLVGSSGLSLTRMGHPGAPDHDHHRSIWFAHHKVLGVDFWSDKTEARIRQKRWLAYQDGDDEALMAVELGWYDGHDPQELLDQQLIVAVRPADEGQTLVELQSTFTPKAKSLELGQTNFGLLAVRVAKTISATFGGGRLTNSEGATGEPKVFGKPARWMDYTGRITNEGYEGITYFEHPKNPGYPNAWHVRDDGWMTSSACMRGAITLTQDSPLTLRYLLHAHREALETARAERQASQFGDLPAYEVVKSERKNTSNEVRRVS